MYDNKSSLHGITCPKLISLAFLIISILAIIGLIRKANEVTTELRASWSGDELYVATSSGGPYVVTHLEGRSKDDNVIAALHDPLIMGRLSQYYRGRMSIGKIDKLNWINQRGDKSSPPASGSVITVIYYRSFETETDAKDP